MGEQATEFPGRRRSTKQSRVSLSDLRRQRAAGGTPQRLATDDPERIPGRRPIPPLRPGWLVVDQLPMFHRYAVGARESGETLVHVHGFGISGTYLEPTAALLARTHRTFVPDLPGMGRSLRPRRGLDLPALARSLVSYLDAVGAKRVHLIGNSLGCPTIIEVAATFPERVKSAVLISPAGGPNNQPLGRALHQMAQDGFREPLSMLPIAARDYLHFGVAQSLGLFHAMTRYPTVGNLHLLTVPTLVVAGVRDPLVNFSRAFLLRELPHVTAIRVPGAHALNFSSPELIAELIEAHLAGTPVLEGPFARESAELVELTAVPET